MRKKRLNYPLWILFLVALPQVLFSSCNEDKEDSIWVDLRYNPHDRYELNHTSPEEIAFEVSSTKDWRVYGAAEWHTIDPAEGEPGEIYIIRIKAENNTVLDDRTDTITIQSDYWIGKKFVVFQKGTAFITIDDAYTVPKDGGEEILAIRSNQDWSVAVTKGNEWLSISGGSSGTMDGEIKISLVANKGEKRSGEISVYDRNQDLYKVVTLMQEGVILNPAELSIRVPKPEGTYRLDVESNTEWKVSKPDDIGWLILNNSSSDGDGVVEISYMENSGSAVRKAELIFETIGGEDVEPVVKTVVLKQAPTLAPTRYQFDEGPNWGQWTSLKHILDGSDIITNVPGNTEDRCRTYIDNQPLGIYTFRIKETSMRKGDQSNIYLGLLFSSDDYNGYTFAVNSDSRTEAGAPGSPAVNNTGIDITQPHTITISLAQEDGNMLVEWWANDEVFASYKDTSFKPSRTDITILLGFENASWFVGNSMPGVEKGAVFDWWEYSPPVDWGD